MFQESDKKPKIDPLKDIDSTSTTIIEVMKDKIDSFNSQINAHLYKLLKYNSEFIYLEDSGVTIYSGGPLNHAHRLENPWIHGIEVRDEHGYTNFHLICFNCSIDDLSYARVIVNLSPEIEKKFGANTSETQELEQLLRSSFQEPTVVVRPSITGCLVFPLMKSPAEIPTAAIFKNRLQKLLKKLKLNYPVEDLDVSPIMEQQPEFLAEDEYYIVTELKVIHNEKIGNLYVYGLFSKEDKWYYYELISVKPLQFPLPSEISLKNTQVRLDSGCDSGMLYNDEGCDCRHQLTDALTTIAKNDGLIIHCPTQDGRGYGFNTKMETEAHKRGIEAVLNQDNPQPTDTLTVARKLFGEQNYDIRDFHAVGKILASMGFCDISLITDNKKKLKQVAQGGKQINPKMKVSRQPTLTVKKGYCNTCLNHVKKKHEDDLYF